MGRYKYLADRTASPGITRKLIHKRVIPSQLLESPLLTRGRRGATIRFGFLFYTTATLSNTFPNRFLATTPI
ncbi:hypothetical protein Mapa_008294 [Marchantia paleacea]|nr:hypothetical protein Mapa_008294 [Marchantia paleacea]